MDYIKAYEFYKVYFDEENNKDKIGDCPFCLSDGHFSVHKTEGTYRCFKCEESGNLFTFLTTLHHHFLERTTLAEYRTLADSRGLPSKIIKASGFAYDPDWKRWLVPFQNGSKFLNNLGVIYPKHSYRILKCPGLPLKFFRPFDKQRLEPEVWIFEGEWDLLAAQASLKQDRVKIRPSLVSSCGATTWTEDMNKNVQGKSCTFFWDNDLGGQDKGRKAIEKRISGTTYHFIDWSSFQEIKDKVKDVRDLWTTRKERESESVYQELRDLASNTSEIAPDSPVTYTTNLDDIPPVETYEAYREGLRRHLYLNDSMFRTYEIVQASALSINLPDKPLWMFVVAPASAGKSELVESYGGSSEYFDYVSKLTSESLVSHYHTKSGEDLSLLPKLNRKTLFIGDLTVILSLPPQVQEKLWGLLRDAYQGIYKSPAGNEQSREYRDFKFNIVAGVTHAIYALNDSDMGERFIKVDLLGRDFDEDAHMDAAIRGQRNWSDIKDALKKTVMGYYKHLQQSTDFTKISWPSDKITDKIKLLAKLTTKLRTKVQKDRWEGMIARPVSESPTRFATQCMTLAKSLMVVRQTDRVDPDLYQSIAKVAFDSCPGLALEVVLYLHKHKRASISTLNHELRMPKQRVRQIVDDFTHLGVLSYATHTNGSGVGRNIRKYELSDTIISAVTGSSPRKFSRKPKKV